MCFLKLGVCLHVGTLKRRGVQVEVPACRPQQPRENEVAAPPPIALRPGPGGIPAVPQAPCVGTPQGLGRPNDEIPKKGARMKLNTAWFVLTLHPLRIYRSRGHGATGYNQHLTLNRNPVICSSALFHTSRGQVTTQKGFMRHRHP